MMESNTYKEMSYRARGGYRVVGVVVAAVVVFLCVVVGIGCWMLIDGVRENEKFLNNPEPSAANLDGVGFKEEIRVAIVEGEVKEPLNAVAPHKPMNKVDKVAKHIAEIDFSQGSPVDSEEQVAVAHLQHAQLVPAAAEPVSDEVEASEEGEGVPPHVVDPNAYKTSFSHRYDVVNGGQEAEETPLEPNPAVPVPPETFADVEPELINDHPSVFRQRLRPPVSGEPFVADGVFGIKIDPTSLDNVDDDFRRRVGSAAVDESAATYNGHYGVDQLAVDQRPTAVYIRPQESRPSGNIIESLLTFGASMAEGIRSSPSFQAFQDVVKEQTQQLAQAPMRMLEEYSSHLLNPEDEPHHRSTRSAFFPFGSTLVKYVSYAGFAKYLYNELSVIADYNVHARKLSGDPEANFLDALFWSPSSVAAAAANVVGKIAHAEVASPIERVDIVENSENSVSSFADSSADSSPTVPESQQPTFLSDDGWEPQVNQVSLEFVSEMLTTLLNMMREYLLKDHVMECLWFMFCEDLNHQAKYSDIYGVLARINSVGLKVLTAKEGREVNTISEIWRALSSWEVLQCEAMFPKCDGTKALEIVNEVANGSRRK